MYRNNNQTSCMCMKDNSISNLESIQEQYMRNNQFPENPLYAQSYVPWQIMNKTFMPEDGLKMGTIYPELVSPYMPGDSMRFIEYIKNNRHREEGCSR